MSNDRALTHRDLRISFACATDVGMTRKNNEDALAVASLADGTVIRNASDDRHFTVTREGVLLAVSDGMGGAKAGEVASEIVIGAFVRAMRDAQRSRRDARQALKAAVRHAHDEVVEAAQDDAMAGMGATLTAVYVTGRSAFVAEVGDSRAYLIRQGIIHQLTRDQNIAQSLVDKGQLLPTEVQGTPMCNVLSQVMGQPFPLQPELARLELRDGDELLICSDGLTGVVDDKEILVTVQSAGSLHEACKGLVERANQGGGPDNSTVILARVTGSLARSKTGEGFAKSFKILEHFDFKSDLASRAR